MYSAHPKAAQTKATLNTIDQFLKKESREERNGSYKGGLALKKEKDSLQWGSSFLTSKVGCRTYLEHRLGGTVLEESMSQENKRSGHSACEAQIARLSQEVAQQKTIIQLQEQLITKLLGQVEETHSPSQQDKKLLEAFSGISKVRSLLEQALK